MRSFHMPVRLTALLLTLALLMCLLPAAYGAETVSGMEDEPGPIQVVYIPLDDRPFHTDRMELMASSLGIQLIMPDADLYNTILDKQASGSQQYGNRRMLLSWLQREAPNYDTFVISLDQLLSGGLMNSRCMEKMEGISYSYGEYMTEYEVIDYLVELSQEKDVYIIDSVLRLACSNNYRGYTLRDYNLTRAYGMLPRFVLGGDALTVDNIVRYYGSTGSVDETHSELMEKYLAVRERKLRLSDYAARHLAGRENVHYLLGVDDSSGGNNVQSNEIAYLEQFMGENDLIFSAVDGLGQAALAKIYSLSHPMPTIRMSIDYFGSDPENIGEYNFLSTETMLEQEIPYYGGQIVTEDPEISVVVLSAPEDPMERGNVFLSAISRLNENENNQIPTILIDLTESPQRQFHEMLLEGAHLGGLLSYSGNYERPVQVTMALSQGMARYQSLWNNPSREEHVSHLKNLLSALVKEHYKVGAVRDTLAAYWTKEGLDQDNFGNLWSWKRREVKEVLTRELQNSTKALMENFTSSNVLLSLPDYRLGGITGATLGECDFPWVRAFEIECQVSCGYGDTPHEYQFIPAYVSGMEDGSFGPGENLTRNQAAKILVTGSGLKPDKGTTCQFPDVPAWAKGYVQTAYQKGYIKGYGDNAFRGNKTMTRAEFASLLIQFMKAEGMEIRKVREMEFTDLGREDAAWYTDNVYLLADAGWISGYEDGSFRPEGNVTRAEAVKLLGQLLGRSENIPQWIMSAARFPDMPESHWAYSMVQEAGVSRFVKK